MTIGVPDFQDPRQPQPVGDRLVFGDIPSGSSTATRNLSNPQGIYQYIGVQVTVPVAMNVYVALAGTFGPNPIGYNRWCYPGTTNSFNIPTSGFYSTGTELTISTAPAVSGGNLSYYVYGLRVFPNSLRYDGLYPPQNSQTFPIPYTSGTQAAGPVLPTPNRVLVGAIVPPACLMTSTTGTGEIYGNAGGGNVTLATGVGLEGEYMVWNVVNTDNGILMDPGVTMGIILPAGITSGSPGCLYYDEVS